MSIRCPAALAAAISLGFVPGFAAAQNVSPPPPTQPPTTSVQLLVVTPTRLATPIDAQASAVTLITAEQIEAQQWRTLPAALATAPGLNLTQTGGPGGLTSVFIRGLDSGHTKVLIDGVDAQDPSVGGFDFGQQLTSGLARVEILRGPASSLYGSDALGGVVAIVTAPGSGPPRLSASLEGGSFDTLNETARLAGGGHRADYALDFAHFFAGATPVTPRSLLGPGEALHADRYDNYTGALKADVTLSPWLGLGLVARYLMSDLRSTGEDFAVYPAGPDAVQTDQYERALFTRAEARVTSLGGALKNVVGVGYTFYHTTIQAPDESDGAGLPPPVIDDGDRLRGDWQGTLSLWGRADLVAGADVQRDRLIASPIDAQDARQGGFVELQAHPGDGFNIAGSVRDDHDDRFGGVVTWRVAPAWTLPVTGTILRATYGTGFKAPTLQQLFVNYPQFMFSAKADLQPERSRGWDVGFEQPLGPARFGATWFHNAVRDLIDDNADFTSYANLGRVTTYGLESFVAWRVSGALSLRADYTYTFTRNDLMQNQELLRRPKDKASLTAQWRPARRLSLAASWLYKGGWVDGSRDFSVTRLWAGPYAVANLSGAYALTTGVSVFARIENLFDRRYQDPVGFERPGIGVFGGVKVDFGEAGAGR
ncbi:MAG TPA: TonB-dependent receptor [Caulobacteraceae bacterium]|jgi:vitamin B12 transporter|nr:TonB-dependent receptor [Caulobacteraceae bacterium]